jgi:hypothetical protein
MRIAIAFLALCVSAWAQDIKMPPRLDKLAANAEETTEVTLDNNMLQFASRFMSGKDADEARAKKLISGLKGIYVRSFKFAEEDEYNSADVDAVRAQLQPPAWSRVVGVRSKNGENVEVYFKSSTGNQIGGLVVIAAEPKELTIVNISGNIQPEDLAGLSGEFGVPKLQLQNKPRPKAEPQPAPRKKADAGKNKEDEE